MGKKLIIINGVMGVGKTTVCRELYKSLTNSFWLDGDWCWMMNPFKSNTENRKMVIDNITFMLNNFLESSCSKYVIFNWVIDTDGIMNIVIDNLKSSNYKIYKITLLCSKEELIDRIQKDINQGIRKEEDIEKSLQRYKVYEMVRSIKIDTTNKSVAEVVKEIQRIIS